MCHEMYEFVQPCHFNAAAVVGMTEAPRRAGCDSGQGGTKTRACKQGGKSRHLPSYSTDTGRLRDPRAARPRVSWCSLCQVPPARTPERERLEVAGRHHNHLSWNGMVELQLYTERKKLYLLYLYTKHYSLYINHLTMCKVKEYYANYKICIESKKSDECQKRDQSHLLDKHHNTDIHTSCYLSLSLSTHSHPHQLPRPPLSSPHRQHHHYKHQEPLFFWSGGKKPTPPLLANFISSPSSVSYYFHNRRVAMLSVATVVQQFQVLPVI